MLDSRFRRSQLNKEFILLLFFMFIFLVSPFLRAPEARVKRSAGRWRMPRTSQRLVRVRKTERDSPGFALIRGLYYSISPKSLLPIPQSRKSPRPHASLFAECVHPCFPDDTARNPREEMSRLRFLFVLPTGASRDMR